MQDYPEIVIVLLIVVSGFLLLLALRYFRKAEIAEQAAREALSKAEKEAGERRREILAEVRQEARSLIEQAEREIRERRRELQRAESRADQREQNIERRFQQLEQTRQESEARQEELQEREKEVNRLLLRQRKELERLSGLSSEEAKQVLLKAIEQEIRFESSKLIQELEEEAKREANRRAQEIVMGAIQKCAVDQASDITVSVVSLPNEDMKGRVIGREGRNIRAFENLTGVSLIIDDTPEAVVLSSFDPKRREVARLALEMLLADGRIHPARIEEMYKKATQELEARVRSAAEAAMLETGVSGLANEVVELLGSLKYRTSYGQNVLGHSIEVASLCSAMASELGLNAAMARRAGLLHDIGKAVDAYEEGTHPEIGAEILRRSNEPEEVVLAVGTHHETQPPAFFPVLVQIADAISAGRPGARRETLETYIQRLEKLEQVADSFEGVEKAYAIQAGREIRVMVKPEQIDDFQASRLSRDIVNKIESELQYPGQIRVVVIRETRAIDYAK